MASRKNLLTVDYHYDTDTGLYKIGEIDFGVSGEMDNYLKHYGAEGLRDIKLALAQLIWHVEEYGGRIVRENNAKQITAGMVQHKNSLSV